MTFKDQLTGLRLPDVITDSNGINILSVKRDGKKMIFTLHQDAKGLKNRKATVIASPHHHVIRIPGEGPKTYNAELTSCTNKQLMKFNIKTEDMAVWGKVHGQTGRYKFDSYGDHYFLQRDYIRIDSPKNVKFHFEKPNVDGHWKCSLTDFPPRVYYYHDYLEGSFPTKYTKLPDDAFTATCTSKGLVLDGTMPANMASLGAGQILIESSLVPVAPGSTPFDKDQIPYKSKMSINGGEVFELGHNLVIDKSQALAEGEKIKLAQIGQKVFLDTNGNGVHDSGEKGVAGVKIAIKGKDVNTSVTTDENGQYRSPKLFPGKYDLTFSLPTGHVVTQGKDSTVPANGKVSVTLVEGKDNLGINMGLRKLEPKLVAHKTFAGIQGGKLVYNLSVENKGDADATNVKFDEKMWVQATNGEKVFVKDVKLSKMTQGSFADNQWDIGTIKPKQKVTAQAIASVHDTNGTIYNSFGRPGIQPCVGDDCAEVALGYISLSKNLVKVDKGVATYKVSVKNPSKVAVKNIAIRDIAGKGLIKGTIKVHTPLFSGMTWDSAKNTMTITQLDPGKSMTYTYDIKTDKGSPVLENTIKGSDDGHPGDPSNDKCKTNTDYCVNTIGKQNVKRLVTTQKTYGGINKDGKLTYQLVIENKGDGVEQNLTYVDKMDVIDKDGKTTPYQGKIVANKVSVGKFSGNTWTISALKSGQKATATIVVDSVGYQGVLSNQFGPKDKIGKDCKEPLCSTVELGSISIDKKFVKAENGYAYYNVIVSNDTKAGVDNIVVKDIPLSGLVEKTIEIQGELDKLATWNDKEQLMTIKHLDAGKSLSYSYRAKTDSQKADLLNMVRAWDNSHPLKDDNSQTMCEKDDPYCAMAKGEQKVVQPDSQQNLAVTGSRFGILLITFAGLTLVGASVIISRQKSAQVS